MDECLFDGLRQNRVERGGERIGKTDRDGDYVLERPMLPEDYDATIYEKLGFDHDRRYCAGENRPVFISHGGKAIAELL